MKLPTIDGKEIVPVRLIPLITNAWLGQATFSGILANRRKVSGWPYDSDFDEIEVNVYDEETDCSELKTITRAVLIGPQKRDNGVHAYHVNDDGNPVKMWSSEWDAIYREISVLEPVLRKVEEKNGVPDSMESSWRLKATRILPPGVFLWRDDLDSLWQAHIRCFIRMPNEPPNFRKMNYDAYIRPEYRDLIREGFEHLIWSTGEQEPLQVENAQSFVIDEYMASHRKTINCTRPTCFTCKKHDCRNQLAHDLFTNFGDHTVHRLRLWKIGAALGLPEPTWAVDRDIETQMERQKKEVAAIKSKVRRWIEAHLKKVTPSHPTVTPQK